MNVAPEPQRTEHARRALFRRRVFALALLVALVAVPLRPVEAQEVPELRINSKRYLVLDAQTGEIFAQRGAHERVAIASLTKIFTAIEAIESAPPDLQITTTDADLVSEEASTMGFGPGETFTLRDLLHGLMLPSGNDAAWAIARTLGATPDTADPEAAARFVARINERVARMGLSETNLVNPDGWGVPGHYSSAHDLAAFTMYALRYPRFVELIGAETYDTTDGAYQLRNNNRLLGAYDGLVGGKTGFDLDSGYCLVEVAARDGSTMISVTLDGIAPDDWYDDNRVLLDYAFAQKAARPAGDIVGERIGYLDPDAAIVASVGRAAPSGSIGIQAPPPAAGDGGSAPSASDQTVRNSDPRVATGASLSRSDPVAALAVAASLTALAGLRAFRNSPPATAPTPSATARSRPSRRSRPVPPARSASIDSAPAEPACLA